MSRAGSASSLPEIPLPALEVPALGAPAAHAPGEFQPDTLERDALGYPAVHGDDSPTEDPDATSQAAPPQVRVLPPRDVATLSFVEGPLAGTLVGITRGSSLLLGRGRDAHIRIPDENVSRRHARLSWVDDTCCIEPLGRATTWVEGTPVLSPRVLTSGARIQLGPRVRLRFDLHDAVERRSLSDLYDAAVRDPLTGAHNRRYLEDRLRTELAYSNRHGVPVSLLLIDLDHFKQVNDRHGHEAGDRVLRFVVAALRKTLRPEDVLARYGGEELCVLLRGLDVEQAARLAERIRSSLAALRVPVASGAKLAITASIGVACVPAEPNPTRAESSRPYDGPRGSSPYDGAALIERADRALYAAKHAGRNRCAIAGRLPPRGGAE